VTCVTLYLVGPWVARANGDFTLETAASGPWSCTAQQESRRHEVTITGGGFQFRGTSVQFGSSPPRPSLCCRVRDQRNRTPSASSVPDAGSTVDVTVTNPLGESPLNTNDQFHLVSASSDGSAEQSALPMGNLLLLAAFDRGNNFDRAITLSDDRLSSCRFGGTWGNGQLLLRQSGAGRVPGEALGGDRRAVERGALLRCDSPVPRPAMRRPPGNRWWCSRKRPARPSRC